MSFKGFTKAVARAPQSFRQKMNMGEQVEDPVYEDAERRFKELELEVKKLSEESKRYSQAVNGMLNHQIGFAQAMEEIFKPISGQMSDPNAAVPEDNPQGIEASEQYRALVAELQETLKPDLALIEDKIIKPCLELLKTIGYIRKMATKRNHKKIDLDRRNNTYKKYETKSNPSPKDEEKLFKAQAELEVAKHEYDYYNDMLKDQLPQLFSLEAQFVQPLFVSFYYMQLNIFYTLYTKTGEMKIPYFDMSTDIVEAYHFKKGNVDEQCDSLTITKFKLGYSKAKLEMTKKRYGSGAQSPTESSSGLSSPKSPEAQLAYAGAPGAAAGGYTSPTSYGSHPGFTSPQNSYAQPSYGAPEGAPPAYSTAASPYTTATASPVASTFHPPAPAAAAAAAPAAAAPSVETVTALYDYQAQAPGDLSFPANAVIEIVQRTQDTNEWWTGRYHGQVGVFPGNYVQLNKM
ncbi:hypothetical protein ZYGR_0N04730 [Zygosaccharomyces rouxii]|uniref:Reduced viability upon starvation protein 167 n=1 Tax=Zygosaccharomyces rouxii TaxID=4956 RepID=A0A1Q3A047_ZYGRO|nr:hypothetical protein ZYGR_0N04730 [Zygosaccharomyces rouxii]